MWVFDKLPLATGQDQQCQWGLARLLQLLYGGGEAGVSSDRRKDLKKTVQHKEVPNLDQGCPCSHVARGSSFFVQFVFVHMFVVFCLVLNGLTILI